MKNIVLTGFMGTGKTTISKILSKMLGMPLIDIDEEIEKYQGMTINEIFARFGEPYFRDIESMIIKRISEMRGIIISTGGGSVLREENIRNLKSNGIIFCLTATPDTIFKRTKHHDDRPLLRVPDPMARIKELLEYRMPFYEKADFLIPTDNLTPEEVVEEIIRLWKRVS